MKCRMHVLAASFAIIASIGIGPASAGGLLGGLKDTVNNVTDTVTDTVDKVTDTVGDLTGTGGEGGGTNVGGLLSLNDDGDDALINLDVGGDNLVTAGVGGSVKAGVKTDGLLGGTTVTLDLLGLGLDVTLDLGLVDPTDPNNPNNPNNPNGPVLVGSLGGGQTFKITCAVNNTRQLLQVAANGKITAAEIKAWQRYANVQVIPIKLCPAAKKQVAQILARSQKVNLLRRAVMADALISASLGRTRYDVNDVVAVQRQKAQLVVYVY